MKKSILLSMAAIMTTGLYAEHHTMHDKAVPDSLIEKQRATLAAYTKDKGYGPQSPRDIDMIEGKNTLDFNAAPHYSQMNLCNIHFHENAEHKGGEFTTYAGNGDGHGYHSGFKYNSTLSKEELTPVGHKVCPNEHDFLEPGDTIEIHYVHSTAKVKPGPTLASCLSEAVKNPQLRVEAQVYVLTNDGKGADFMKLTEVGVRNGFQQALHIPNDTGTPIEYDGSTTGPGYNEIASPLQVTWSVRPKVIKVDIHSVDKWCQGNVFKEDHAHGVRNLVINPELLSDN